MNKTIGLLILAALLALPGEAGAAAAGPRPVSKSSTATSAVKSTSAPAGKTATTGRAAASAPAEAVPPPPAPVPYSPNPAKDAAAAEGRSGILPLGIYVGGHLGLSIERMSSRAFKLGSDSPLLKSAKWGMGGETDTAFSGGGNVGYNFYPQLKIPFRLELDYTARTDVKGSSTRDTSVEYLGQSESASVHQRDSIGLQTLLFNGWFDIPTGTSLVPYMGGGLGWGFIHQKTNQSITSASFEGEGGMSTNTANFAWNVGGGLGYDIDQNMAVDLGYRFVDAGDTKASSSNTSSKVKVQSHDIQMGVRFTF